MAPLSQFHYEENERTAEFGRYGILKALGPQTRMGGANSRQEVFFNEPSRYRGKAKRIDTMNSPIRLEEVSFNFCFGGLHVLLSYVRKQFGRARRHMTSRKINMER
jgi:hypothetical protein